MKSLKKFIERKKKEILKKSDEAVKILDREWNDFLKKDIYLIHEEKSRLLKTLENGNKEIKIPWYLFWNYELKSALKLREEKISDYKEDIPNHNKNFVVRKKKEHKDLFQNDSLTLDDNQQTAIITDDRHNLVVAGAGSGKTEVLATRIAYLVKRKSDKIRPERILALAFQKEAAKEIGERIKEKHGVDVEVRTFHSLGNQIIQDGSKKKGKEVPEIKRECSDEWKFRRYIQKIFEENKSDLQKDIINYVKKHGDKEFIKTETDFEKKEHFHKYQRDLRYAALDGTNVKSKAEREILNFFLTNKLNGNEIRIIYEKPAEWRKCNNEKGEEKKPDFYFPDFDIYLEHWATGKDGKVPEWFEGENPTEKYVRTMNMKKEKFKSNNKILIETSHADYEKGEEDFLNVIRERFLSVLRNKHPNEKFVLEEIPYQNFLIKFKKSKEPLRRIDRNVSDFIKNAKINRFYPRDIEKRLESEKWSPRQHAFCKIANHVYEIYQENLKKENRIDYSDMINLAIDSLKDDKNIYRDKYDHILVDEYQDISMQRHELIKELMKKNPDCKLFCVGDDWQSIMGFSGSNLDFFVNFEKYFPHPARTNLTKNYRSIKSIVEAGNCIIRNNKKGQIQKKTISNTDESRPIFVFSLTRFQKKTNVTGRVVKSEKEKIAEHCLLTIKEHYDKKGLSWSDFMILMRIRDFPLLQHLKIFADELKIPLDFEKSKNPNCVRVMTVHKSKGLQAKTIIILNVNKGLMGFPCELENPDILFPAIKNNDNLGKQEERRLFYVAVTRAKEECIIYSQKESESEFIKEIEDFIERKELRY